MRGTWGGERVCIKSVSPSSSFALRRDPSQIFPFSLPCVFPSSLSCVSGVHLTLDWSAVWCLVVDLWIIRFAKRHLVTSDLQTDNLHQWTRGFAVNCLRLIFRFHTSSVRTLPERTLRRAVFALDERILLLQLLFLPHLSWTSVPFFTLNSMT